MNVRAEQQFAIDHDRPGADPQPWRNVDGPPVTAVRGHYCTSAQIRWIRNVILVWLAGKALNCYSEPLHDCEEEVYWPMGGTDCHDMVTVRR